MVLGLWAVLSSPGCASNQSHPSGCLLIGLVLIAAGAAVTAVSVAIVLRHKGALHAIAGSVLCLGVAWRLVSGVARATRFGGPDVLALLALAPVVCVLVALWAAYAPCSHRHDR